MAGAELLLPLAHVAVAPVLSTQGLGAAASLTKTAYNHLVALVLILTAGLAGETEHWLCDLSLHCNCLTHLSKESNTSSNAHHGLHDYSEIRVEESCWIARI
eukprot:TRINITY_DN142_c0_g1_i1.p1 TRINITY_DN142_c0_g1~~TRINITY_DN142_c0_g1_i1.p1  ORF type:complete len:102 (+),score=9.35 TRINITY_DN142_c0_g1_i1:144-449(+)